MAATMGCSLTDLDALDRGPFTTGDSTGSGGHVASGSGGSLSAGGDGAGAGTPTGTASSGGTGGDGVAGSGGASSAYANEVLSDSPLSYWRLGDVASQIAIDLVGGRDGTFVGGIALGQPGALVGDPDKAVWLDGMDDSVLIGDFFDFPVHEAFSLEVWISSESDEGDICAKEGVQLGNEAGYGMYLSIGAVVVHRHGDGVTDVLLGSALTPGFNHVVTTYDGEELKLYVNGGLTMSIDAAASLPDTDLPFRIGAGQDGYNFQGGIDEVAVYSVALPAGRVAAHHAVGAGL
jgi:hypothetical protein